MFLPEAHWKTDAGCTACTANGDGDVPLPANNGDDGDNNGNNSGANSNNNSYNNNTRRCYRCNETTHIAKYCNNQNFNNYNFKK